MNAKAIVVLLLLVATALFFVYSPVEAYTLQILVSSSNYDLSFSPSFFVRQIPRANIMSGYSVSSAPRQYGFLGVNQIILKVNVTAYNSTGFLFFDGKFKLDSLADQKIQLYKTYSGESRTSSIRLHVDASLYVDFEDKADINKTYHGQWNLTLSI